MPNTTKRRIYDSQLHAQFVTFSCYHRRRLLDLSDARQIVVNLLASELRVSNGICSGFVVMPDHVHATVWFPEINQLSPFMKRWKHNSSIQLKKFLRGVLPHYARSTDHKDPFWQPRYYPFNLFSEKKALEKLNYMHMNPVRTGFVENPCDWQHSSARFFDLSESSDVPLKCIF